MAKIPERFQLVFKQGGGLNGNMMRIYVDRETGVNYLYSSYGYSGGLTVLVDREGKPIITPVSTLRAE